VAHLLLWLNLYCMDTFDVKLSQNHDSAALPALIERAVAEAGFQISQFELRGYPGAAHWHLRRRGVKGTLELTYWPRAGRLWFAVHTNRRADWIMPAIDDLTSRIQEALLTSR
jgi:hypothetical protein